MYDKCIVQLLVEVVGILRMVNQLEIELKFENKDSLLVAFGKTNPQAKKPCMSSCIFFLVG